MNMTYMHARRVEGLLLRIVEVFENYSVTLSLG